jgi:hypothetical protein
MDDKESVMLLEQGETKFTYLQNKRPEQTTNPARLENEKNETKWIKKDE